MSKGLLYFAQNSAFQHLTKIGRTTKLAVEDRGLSTTNVPEDFGYLAVFQCENVEWAENRVQEQFAKFRHYTQTGRKTEFFWSGCIKDAIRYAKDLKGVYDKTETETEEIVVVDDSGEEQVKKIATKTTFKMINLPVGTEIYWYNDKSLTAITLDDKNQIKLNDGTKGAISNISDRIYKEKGNAGETSGFWCFHHNGIPLFKLRPDQKDKE